jgi:hypothetical protein
VILWNGTRRFATAAVLTVGASFEVSSAAEYEDRIERTFPVPRPRVRCEASRAECAGGKWSKNEEPSVDDVLTEPTVQVLMARDGRGA